MHVNLSSCILGTRKFGPLDRISAVQLVQAQNIFHNFSKLAKELLSRPSFLVALTVLLLRSCMSS